MTNQSIGQHYLEDAIYTFRYYKKLAEGAFAQISDDHFFRTLDDESNSIAIIMKHMAGNMLSRWTDFLTSDGEKPTRDRDGEFVDDLHSRDDIMAYWNRGWACALNAIEALTPADLNKSVTIRGESH